MLDKFKKIAITAAPPVEHRSFVCSHMATNIVDVSWQIGLNTQALPDGQCRAIIHHLKKRQVNFLGYSKYLKKFDPEGQLKMGWFASTNRAC